ncbi:venom allergen 3-like [Leptopilina heterotoma]|uniref:venom allergen 3-like n=1 Tax=Leptopilina heterotoma TaxID=63436 RepID=UPI001CA9D688|nr:venom allergen 3-like [Leptopilina heterotoma]
MFSIKIVCSFLLILTINNVFAENCAYRRLPAPTCHPIKRGLSPTEEREILQKHNKLRRFLASGAERRGANNRGQPAAAYMPNLVWDVKLKNMAQKWADTCSYAHDMCLFQNNMGQNMGFISNNDDSVLIYTNIVQAWYDEVKDFDGSQVEEVRKFGWSAHYTQMASANTTKVGCGAIVYKDGGLKRIQLICNYSPFVNMVGDALYKRRN